MSPSLPLPLCSLRLVASGLLLTFLHLTISSAQDQCQSTDDLYVFKRVFYFHQETDKTGTVAFDEQLFRHFMGNCTDVEREAQEMLAFMESYGFDMAETRGQIYTPHQTADYGIFAGGIPMESNYKVVMASWDDRAEFLNNPVYANGWFLSAKKDSVGTRGSVKQGTYLGFGNYRFSTGQHDVCIRITANIIPMVERPQVSVLDLDFYHEQWGPGVSRGIEVWNADHSSRDARHILTFPLNA